MLLTRPFILRYRHKHGIVERPEYHRVNSDDEDGSQHAGEVTHNEVSAIEDEEEPEVEFDFGEVCLLKDFFILQSEKFILSWIVC